MAVLTDEAIELLRARTSRTWLPPTRTVPHVMPLWVDVDVDRDLVLFNTRTAGRRRGTSGATRG
jgi:hypothetical protein